MEAIWPLDIFVNVGIQIWALDQHGRDLGCQITLEREGRFFTKNRQKIGDISPINRRYTGFSGDLFIKSPIYRLSPIYHLSPIYRRYIVDFWRRIAPLTYLLHMSFRSPPTCDISAIFRQYFLTFSSLQGTFIHIGFLNYTASCTKHVGTNRPCALLGYS